MRDFTAQLATAPPIHRPRRVGPPMTVDAASPSGNKRFQAAATALLAVLLTIAITLTRFRLGQLDLQM